MALAHEDPHGIQATRVRARRVALEILLLYHNRSDERSVHGRGWAYVRGSSPASRLACIDRSLTPRPAQRCAIDQWFACAHIPHHQRTAAVAPAHTEPRSEGNDRRGTRAARRTYSLKANKSYYPYDRVRGGPGAGRRVTRRRACGAQAPAPGP